MTEHGSFVKTFYKKKLTLTVPKILVNFVQKCTSENKKAGNCINAWKISANVIQNCANDSKNGKLHQLFQFTTNKEINKLYY